jgi:hypothetical protein
MLDSEPPAAPYLTAKRSNRTWTMVSGRPTRTACPNSTGYGVLLAAIPSILMLVRRGVLTALAMAEAGLAHY